jgi:hypothetical protein
MKRGSLSLLICGLVTVFMSGCATPTKYYWGNYEQSLYNHYKHPGDIEKFQSELSKTIARAEKKKRVPPGLYAEYGYVLLREGKNDEAIRYFKKERQLWPESVEFMNAMIKTAHTGGPRAYESQQALKQ